MRLGNLAVFEDNVADADWAFFCRYDIVNDGELYLRRWRIFQTPAFAVYLHKILRPDIARDLHDHPWSFASLVLKNGYYENYAKFSKVGATAMSLQKEKRRVNKWLRLVWHRAEDFHIITDLVDKSKPAWTLFLTGPRRREWGFLVDNYMWVSHNEYDQWQEDNPVEHYEYESWDAFLDEWKDV